MRDDVGVRELHQTGCAADSDGVAEPGDRLAQRTLFAVDHRWQQFPGAAFQGPAFIERDQHLDRQLVDPEVPFLPLPPMPGLGIQRRRRAVCRTDPIRHPSHYVFHPSLT